jgi:single-strand DNA-binding protein
VSIVASIHGRITKPPIERETKAGKSMAIGNCAVDVTGRDETDQQTLWVSIMCFNDLAAQLASVKAGESVSAFGRMTRGTWTTTEGETRESWTMLCDGLVTTRSARPGQRTAKTPGTDRQRNDASRRAGWEQQGDELAF